MDSEKGSLGADRELMVVPTGYGVRSSLEEARTQLDRALAAMVGSSWSLQRAASTLVTALGGGHTIMAAGNGGSAAEAQHFVAELVGRFKMERPPYRALALTSDTAVLTALANDYGYRHVFGRQVAGIGRAGDVLVLFSTSGESENLLEAVHAGRRLGVFVIGITGDRPCRLAEEADLAVRVPSGEPARIQELHMIVTHTLCEVVERALTGESVEVLEAVQPARAGVGA